MKTLYTLFIILLPFALFAQQVADTDYNPEISKPMYAKGKGSIVFIDEGHHNFHTKDGRYRAFAQLIERDGYQVKAYQGLFTKKKLAQGKILVISNALNKKNVEDWFKPTLSAFTQEEIEIVKAWIQEGGSLFLIADHMPMGGAAKDLAAAFGFKFTDGFARKKGKGPDAFTLQENTLHKNTITNGRNTNESVDRIITFTGQAFQIPDDAKPILSFNDQYTNWLPEEAWEFNKKTERYEVEGWSQGAYKKFGQGRIVAFGEAAMFTAQLSGPQKRKMGMSNPVAPQNYQLLLNIIHWLDGKLDE